MGKALNRDLPYGVLIIHQITTESIHQSLNGNIHMEYYVSVQMRDGFLPFLLHVHVNHSLPPYVALTLVALV